VRAAAVEQEHVDFCGVLRVCGGEVVQKGLQAIAVRGGQFQDEARPALGFHCAKEPEALKELLKWTDGFYTAQGQPAAQHGVQAKTALVLCPQA
jgi:hypothetical protein